MPNVVDDEHIMVGRQPPPRSARELPRPSPRKVAALAEIRTAAGQRRMSSDEIEAAIAAPDTLTRVVRR
jgi:hypothetical protein